MRGFSSAVISTLQDRYVRIIRLVEVDFEALGVVRLANTVRDITYNGNTYVATGGLLGISEVEESSTFEQPNSAISFSINNSIKSLLLNTQFVGKRLKIFEQWQDRDGAELQTYLLYDGLMDGLDYTDDYEGQTATVNVPLTSYLAKFDDKGGRRTNPETHRADFPGDSFFDQVPSLIDKTVKW